MGSLEPFLIVIPAPRPGSSSYTKNSLRESPRLPRESECQRLPGFTAGATPGPGVKRLPCRGFEPLGPIFRHLGHDAEETDGQAAPVAVGVGNPGGNEDTVSRPDQMFLPVQREGHFTLEHHLLVLDRFMAVFGDPAPRLHGETPGDEVGCPIGGAQQHLNPGPLGVFHGAGFWIIHVPDY